MECSICMDQITEPVKMTCSSQHSFCFKCIIKSVEATSELKPCAMCRGGNKYIINDQSIKNHFFESLPMINKLTGNQYTNSCLVSEASLVFYSKNKKQLELFSRLAETEEDLNEIVKCIKWERPISAGARSIFGDIFNNSEFNELYTNLQFLPLASNTTQLYRN
jgi:Zinc finger, C3HC4 type (RING finger)